MQMFDEYKFQQEIKKFKETLAPTNNQWNYLQGKKNEVEVDILIQANKSGQSVERCLLVALCGELTNGSSKQEQAEFASKLILLDLLME